MRGNKNKDEYLQPHVPNPFAPHNTGLQSTHWGLSLISLGAKPCTGGLGLRTGFMWGKQADEQWGLCDACGWLWPSTPTCPTDPRAKVYPLSLQLLRPCAPERWRLRTLGQRGEMQKSWGGAEASSGQRRSEREVTLRTTLCHRLRTHTHLRNTHRDVKIFTYGIRAPHTHTHKSLRGGTNNKASIM